MKCSKCGVEGHTRRSCLIDVPYAYYPSNDNSGNSNNNNTYNSFPGDQDLWIKKSTLITYLRNARSMDDVELILRILEDSIIH